MKKASSPYRTSSIDPVKLGQRIRQIRKKQGLTIRKLANKLGISFALLGFYERGERRVPIDMLYEISQMGGVSIDWLITGQEFIGGIDDQGA